MKTSHKRGAALLLATLVASGLAGVTAPTAAADDVPAAPSVFEGKVDVKDPDLKLPEGGTLSKPKVLELKTIIGDEGGSESREDSQSKTKFTLQSEVLFGKDSARLSNAADARIKDIAEEIKKQHATKVSVFGFTDNLGSSAHGDVLSKQRAEAVQKTLNEGLGDSSISFEIRGYGEQAPIASNDSDGGRKKNRRVEVSFPRSEGSES